MQNSALHKEGQCPRGNFTANFDYNEHKVREIPIEKFTFEEEMTVLGSAPNGSLSGMQNPFELETVCPVSFEVPDMEEHGRFLDRITSFVVTEKWIFKVPHNLVTQQMKDPKVRRVYSTRNAPEYAGFLDPCGMNHFYLAADPNAPEINRCTFTLPLREGTIFPNDAPNPEKIIKGGDAPFVKRVTTRKVLTEPSDSFWQPGVRFYVSETMVKETFRKNSESQTKRILTFHGFGMPKAQLSVRQAPASSDPLYDHTGAVKDLDEKDQWLTVRFVEDFDIVKKEVEILRKLHAFACNDEIGRAFIQARTYSHCGCQKLIGKPFAGLHCEVAPERICEFAPCLQDIVGSVIVTDGPMITLQEIIDRFGPLSAEYVMPGFFTILDALENFLYPAGIHHMQILPRNIMICNADCSFTYPTAIHQPPNIVYPNEKRMNNYHGCGRLNKRFSMVETIHFKLGDFSQSKEHAGKWAAYVPKIFGEKTVFPNNTDRITRSAQAEKICEAMDWDYYCLGCSFWYTYTGQKPFWFEYQDRGYTCKPGQIFIAAETEYALSMKVLTVFAAFIIFKSKYSAAMPRRMIVAVAEDKLYETSWVCQFLEQDHHMKELEWGDRMLDRWTCFERESYLLGKGSPIHNLPEGDVMIQWNAPQFRSNGTAPSLTLKLTVQDPHDESQKIYKLLDNVFCADDFIDDEKPCKQASPPPSPRSDYPDNWSILDEPNITSRFCDPLTEISDKRTVLRNGMPRCIEPMPLQYIDENDYLAEEVMDHTCNINQPLLAKEQAILAVETKKIEEARKKLEITDGKQRACACNKK